MSEATQPTCPCPPKIATDHVGAWMEIVTLFVVATFMGFSYLMDKVGAFVAPSYIWLTPAASVALYAMFLARLVAYFRGHDPSELEEQSAWQVPLSGCMLVLFAPIVLGLIVNPTQMTAEGARKRRVSSPPHSAKLQGAFDWVMGLVRAEEDAGDQPAPVLPKNPTVLDLLGIVDEGHGESVEGQFVTLVGQCDLRDGPEGERFDLYRLVITCCIADATSVSVEVARTPNVKLESGGWVRVSGMLKFDSELDPSMPVVDAATISKIPEPSNPYL